MENQRHKARQAFLNFITEPNHCSFIMIYFEGVSEIDRITSRLDQVVKDLLEEVKLNYIDYYGKDKQKEYISTVLNDAKSHIQILIDYHQNKQAHRNFSESRSRYTPVYLLEMLRFNQQSVIEVMNWLLQKLDEKHGGNSETEAIKNFDDLFDKPEDLKRCLDALRKVEPAIIDNDNNYILGGRSKGAFVALIQVFKGKIKTVDEKALSKLLNDKFKGLNISDRTLRNPHTKAYDIYFKSLTTLITR